MNNRISNRMCQNLVAAIGIHIDICLLVAAIAVIAVTRSAVSSAVACKKSNSR